MAELLLARVEVVEARVEGSGTETEKGQLLPKLDDLKKAIGDLTAHYDARLAEVKERNQKALQELLKLERRVKTRAPENKENQENSEKAAQKTEAAKSEPVKPKEKKEKVKERKPERFAPLLAPAARRMPVAWEQDMPWDEVGLPWDTWSLPHCAPCPTLQAEFFPLQGPAEVHTDQLWSPAATAPLVRRASASPREIDGRLSSSPALTFIPTPSPEWEDSWDALQPIGSILTRPTMHSAA